MGRPQITEEAVQYGPAFNNLGVAWQVYHGDGANARCPAAGGVGRRRPGDLGRLLRPRRVLLQHPLRPEGFVLINRYREAPVGGVPRDSTGAVLMDSVMTGRIAGSRIVYARTTITTAHDETRRTQYTYSNGVVIYLNGRPLAFAMNPGGLRSNLGVMAKAGDAVYLPLRRGQNQIVFAVIECTGGWAFSARLEAP